MPSILALVERQVVPRLVRARIAAGPAADPCDGQTVQRLAERLLLDDPRPAAALFASLRAGGAAPELLCLGLLTDAARLLGEWWEQDRASFSDVTIGTLRLQGLLHEIAPTLAAAAGLAATGSILLLPVPGEQHGFGVSMLSEFFRHAGWQVHPPLASSGRDASAQVRAQELDVVGFSIASDQHVDILASQVAAVRAASRRPGLIVMVGGPVLLAQPELTRRLGADATAATADEAVRFAGSLLRARLEAQAANPGNYAQPKPSPEKKSSNG